MADPTGTDPSASTARASTVSRSPRTTIAGRSPDTPDLGREVARPQLEVSRPRPGSLAVEIERSDDRARCEEGAVEGVGAVITPPAHERRRRNGDGARTASELGVTEQRPRLAKRPCVGQIEVPRCVTREHGGRTPGGRSEQVGEDPPWLCRIVQAELQALVHRSSAIAGQSRKRDPNGPPHVNDRVEQVRHRRLGAFTDQ